MKALILSALVIAASLAEAAPEGVTAARHKGVDLLTVDCVHDAYGKLVVILPQKTPFDSDANASKRYLDAYETGFRSGYEGHLTARAEGAQLLSPGDLEGWSAGQWTGYRSQQKEALSRSHP